MTSVARVNGDTTSCVCAQCRSQDEVPLGGHPSPKPSWKDANDEARYVLPRKSDLPVSQAVKAPLSETGMREKKMPPPLQLPGTEGRKEGYGRILETSRTQKDHMIERLVTQNTDLHANLLPKLIDALACLSQISPGGAAPPVPLAIHSVACSPPPPYNSTPTRQALGRRPRCEDLPAKIQDTGDKPSRRFCRFGVAGAASSDNWHRSSSPQASLK